MPKKELAGGVAHKMPEDLQKAISSSPKALKAWQEKITPLARNEWICWTVTVKRVETRREHVQRTRDQLAEGKRRPCCWAGCPHRKNPNF